MRADVHIYPASSRHIGEIAASVLILFRGGALDSLRVSDIKVWRPDLGTHGYQVSSVSLGGLNERTPLGRAIVEAFRAGHLRLSVDLTTGAELVAA